MPDTFTIGFLLLAALALVLRGFITEMAKDIYGVLKKAIVRRFRREGRASEEAQSPVGSSAATESADVSARERLAARWVVELLAAVFVDAMRMFYVGASGIARRANEHRYADFRQMAEDHLADYDRQMARFSADLDPKILLKIKDLESALRRIVSKLIGGPCAPDRSAYYLGHLTEAAEELSTLCVEAAIDHYPQTKETIDSLVVRLWTSSAGEAPLDRLFKVRLKAQSEFLEQTQRDQRWPLFTIGDDFKQRLALAYFLIDLALFERGQVPHRLETNDRGVGAP